MLPVTWLVQDVVKHGVLQVTITQLGKALINFLLVFLDEFHMLLLCKAVLLGKTIFIYSMTDLARNPEESCDVV